MRCRVDDTDALRFERLAAEARALEPHEGVDLRAQALALFTGPVFGDLRSEPWARAEASRLEALRARVVDEQDEALSLLAGGTVSSLDEEDDLTTGTLTFLFTDIVDSTATWEAEPDTMQHDLYHHDRIVLAAIAKWNGHPFGSGGDGFSAVFRDPSDAVHAAIGAQVALRDHPWTSRHRIDGPDGPPHGRGRGPRPQLLRPDGQSRGAPDERGQRRPDRRLRHHRRPAGARPAASSSSTSGCTR